MKITSALFIISLFLLIPFPSFSQSTGTDSPSTKILPGDLKIILGEWTGSLTYIDYTSGNPFTMPADLVVMQGKNENQVLLSNSYPNEPKANNTNKIKIKKGGTILNKSHVKTREELPNGQIRITTENAGKDNRKNALIRQIYILGGERFIMRKEVKFEDSEDWIKRNEFEYERN